MPILCVQLCMKEAKCFQWSCILCHLQQSPSRENSTVPHVQWWKWWPTHRYVTTTEDLLKSMHGSSLLKIWGYQLWRKVLGSCVVMNVWRNLNITCNSTSRQSGGVVLLLQLRSTPICTLCMLSSLYHHTITLVVFPVVEDNCSSNTIRLCVRREGKVTERLI